MNIPACIMPTTAAAVAIVDSGAMSGRTGCFSTIGTLDGAEEILIQRALVAAPDQSNDAHWATLSLNDTEATLRVGHDAEPIPISMILRVSKPATTNAVGVGWS